MQPASLYPYSVTHATLHCSADEIPFTPPENSEVISTQSALIMYKVSLQTIQAICYLVTTIKESSALYVSRKAHTFCSHSFMIERKDALTQVFISTVAKQKEFSKQCSQRNVFLLSFDSQGRFIRNPGVTTILKIALPKEDEEHLERRLSIMQKLEACPHFPKNYAYIERNEKVHVYQEIATGGDLLNYDIRIPLNTFLTEENKLNICETLLKALIFMHAKGIIHRDLKLDNILVFEDREKDREIRVKITDFDLSTIEDDEKSLISHCGTFAWHAPEMYYKRLKDVESSLRFRPIDKNLDNWGLGLLIYSLCHTEVFSLQQKLYELEASIEKSKPIESTKSEIMRLIDTLPSPVTPICTLKDLAKALLQKEPSDRLSLDKALQIVHALQGKGEFP